MGVEFPVQEQQILTTAAAAASRALRSAGFVKRVLRKVEMNGSKVFSSDQCELRTPFPTFLFDLKWEARGRSFRRNTQPAFPIDSAHDCTAKR